MSIEPKHLCREYIAHRRRLGRGDGTISRELGMVRAALYYANKGRFAEFEFPPRPPANARYLTHEEYYRLLCAAMAPHIELFIVLALATAGRACAVLELTWNRVDFKRGLIYLGRQEEARRKGRAIVPLLDTVRPYLNKALDAAETDHVIEYRGAPVKSIKHGFKRTVKRAGLVNVTPHSLRHTAAVWMAESGKPMSEIAQYLGHRDSQITVYARYSPHYLRLAAAALEIPTGFRTQQY